MRQKIMIPEPLYDEILICLIKESLKSLGFDPHINGYRYIRDAVFYYAKMPYSSRIITNVYSKVSQKNNTAPACIIYCIRKCIEDTWYNGTLNKGHELFNWPVLSTACHPSNAEFISLAAELMKIKIRRKELRKQSKKKVCESYACMRS